MSNANAQEKQGPKFSLNIEGVIHAWDHDTITTEQIITLGGWSTADGAIMIDQDNNETTLKPGQVIQLKPGMGFAKKVRFKRGGVFEDRLEQEIALLKGYFPLVEYKPEGRWIRVEPYRLIPGWGVPQVPVCFQVPVGHPGSHPYGFCVPLGLRFNGQVPGNYTEPAGNPPPYEGGWGFFSWSPDGEGQWRATSDVRTGHNLLDYTLTFADRFQEGA